MFSNIPKTVIMWLLFDYSILKSIFITVNCTPSNLCFITQSTLSCISGRAGHNITVWLRHTQGSVPSWEVYLFISNINYLQVGLPPPPPPPHPISVLWFTLHFKIWWLRVFSSPLLLFQIIAYHISFLWKHT